MQTVIGILSKQVSPDPDLQELMGTRNGTEQVHILASVQAVQEILDCDPRDLLQKYILWGAALGMLTYLPFAALAAFCECGLNGFGQVYGAGTFFGGLLAGALVGSAIGALVGAGEAEKDTHCYIQHVRSGDRVIAVITEQENTAQIIKILQQKRVSAIKTL